MELPEANTKRRKTAENNRNRLQHALRPSAEFKLLIKWDKNWMPDEDSNLD